MGGPFTGLRIKAAVTDPPPPFFRDYRSLPTTVESEKEPLRLSMRGRPVIEMSPRPK